MAENVVVSLEVLQVPLDWLCGTDGDYYLKLFSNNYTPVQGMAPGDFTEVTGGAYAHKTIDASGDFTKQYANTPPDIILAEQTFTFTGVIGGTGIVYGWYLIKQDSSKVRVAKLLDTPYTPASGGGTLKFTPRVQAGNGTPA